LKRVALARCVAKASASLTRGCLAVKIFERSPEGGSRQIPGAGDTATPRRHWHRRIDGPFPSVRLGVLGGEPNMADTVIAECFRTPDH